MRPFITTTAVDSRANPWAKAEYGRIIRAAKASRGSVHTMAAGPDDADIILFVGCKHIYHADILASPLFKQHGEKCMVIDPQDNTIPLLPGLYSCVPSYLKTVQSYQAYPYLRVFDNQALDRPASQLPNKQQQFLYSFTGKSSSSPKTRSSILQLKDDRALLKDANTGQTDGCDDYATNLFNSKFVLCPRGYTATTWRIYETMRVGRVPVIIADDWLAPRGLPWHTFSLQIPEAEIGEIPEKLRHMEARAESMGAAAKAAWNEHLSLESCFGWLCNRLGEIDQSMHEHGDQRRRTRLLEALASKQHRSAFCKEKIFAPAWGQG